MAGMAQAAPRVRHGRTRAEIAEPQPRPAPRPRYAALDERGAAYLRANYRAKGAATCALGLARLYGMPVSSRTAERWAKSLGLTRQYRRHDDLANVTLDDISANLPAARAAERMGASVAAVRAWARRLGLRFDTDLFTAAGLADALGVSPRTVGRWIDEGRLGATPRDTDRTEGQGDIWRISAVDVGRFLAAHAADAYPRGGVTFEQWCWALPTVWDAAVACERARVKAHAEKRAALVAARG